MVMFRRSWALPLQTKESVSRDDSHGESLSSDKLSNYPGIKTRVFRLCVFSKQSSINQQATLTLPSDSSSPITSQRGKKQECSKSECNGKSEIVEDILRNPCQKQGRTLDVELWTRKQGWAFSILFLSNPILESDSCFVESCRFLFIDSDSESDSCFAESDSDSFLSKIVQYLQNCAIQLLHILEL